MALEATLARITELRTALAPPAPATADVAVGGDPTFANLLHAAGPAATAGVAPLAPPLPGGAGGAGALLAAAQKEVGVAEQPPGSNDSPRIAQFRQATAGSGVGPWCAYFTSWAAREAGVPLGDQGQGFGSVDALYAWAQGAGRAVPASAGQQPRPGDLIVWDEHIGIVESVLPDGRIQTIEGNSSDQVARRVHAPGDALGYVRMS
jgi:hypothetical protein